MPGNVLGYITDEANRSLAYFTETDLFSSRRGTDAGGERVGTYENGRLYKLNGEFIGFVTASGVVSGGQALGRLLELCT